MCEPYYVAKSCRVCHTVLKKSITFSILLTFMHIIRNNVFGQKSSGTKLGKTLGRYLYIQYLSDGV